MSVSIRRFLPYLSWWLLLTVIQFIIVHRFNFEWCIAMTDALLSTCVLAVASYVINNTFRYYTPATGKYIYGLAIVAALTIICVAIISHSLNYIFTGNNEYILFLNQSVPVRFLLSLLMISLMGVTSWLRFYMKEQSEYKKRKDDAALLLREAELSKLRQQLQPHFLFNSLNSISSLAGSRPEEARKMIQQLSDFLRGTLKKDDQQLVLLSEELQHLQLYLDIEKVRFGHRLTVEIICDEKTEKVKLPSLLLQPIVENAIKFGLYDTTGDIIISIKATTFNQQLIIVIENPFDAETSGQQPGIGFGLGSVQRRLYLLYSRNDLLAIEKNGSTFRTIVKIPQSK